jgi:uncharacterized membrane protein YphA (DoxX/SURF4 family)
MEILFLVGRIIVGVYYVMTGLNHFTQTEGMAQMTAAKKVPSPRLAVLGSGALLILGGLSFLLGIYPLVGVALIVIFLLPTTFMMHNFWADTDPMMKMGNMINFMKNMGLIGYTLMLLAIPQPWPYSLGG